MTARLYFLLLGAASIAALCVYGAYLLVKSIVGG
jgi:hypothetical protein